MQCPICKIEFASQEELDDHQCDSSLNPEKNYICPYMNCGKTFAWASHLNRHIRAHTGARPYTCEYL